MWAEAASAAEWRGANEMTYTACLLQWCRGQDTAGVVGKHLLDSLVSLSRAVREEMEPREGKEPAKVTGLPHFLMRTPNTTAKKNKAQRSSQGQQLGARGARTLRFGLSSRWRVDRNRQSDTELSRK